MRKEIDKNQASRLINCGMVVMVSAAYKDKKNVTTCAWHQPLSKSPSAVGVALAKKHFSSELIKQSQEFIINVPCWGLLDKVVMCGSLSGWKNDKFKEAKFTPQKAHTLVKVDSINECIGIIECSLVGVKEVGDHYFFIGEVVYAEAEEKYFANGFWDTSKVDLIFHLGGRYFCKSSPYIEYK